MTGDTEYVNEVPSGARPVNGVGNGTTTSNGATRLATSSPLRLDLTSTMQSPWFWMIVGAGIAIGAVCYLSRKRG